MFRLYRIVSLFFVAALFFQCQKEISHIGGPDTVLPNIALPDPITSNLQGNVLDENNQPAAGVTIKVGNTTVMTDAKGYFRILNASLDKKTSFVAAEKAGYFPGYRVFPATKGTNHITIKLITKTLAGTVSATAGGDATLTNGSKISLPANGVVVKASGAPYAGDVNVYAAYIDPSSVDINTTVPGSFAANDKNGNRVALTSYGMLAVELESASGEKLQIKQGSAATLTSPIPAAALATAPATIAMWYVDEQTGIWKEEGTATRQGNTYVGTVSHFSFWNCDVAVPTVNITVTILSADSIPVVHAGVVISRQSSGWQSNGYGRTDSLGQVGGLVPANENLVLKVYDPCGNVIYTHNIPAIALTQQIINVGSLYVPASNASVITFKGKIVACNGAPVANGYAIITNSNIVRYAATDANGEFKTSFVTCNGSAGTSQVIGIDEANGIQSSVVNVTMTAPVTDAGTISACGVSTAQFVNWTLNGTNYAVSSANPGDSLTAFAINQGPGFTYVSIMANQMPPGTAFLNLEVNNATAVGTYPASKLNVDAFPFGSIVLMQPFNVTFTSFANTAGEFYEGSFSGNFSAGLPTVVHSINGTFRIRRNN